MQSTKTQSDEPLQEISTKNWTCSLFGDKLFDCVSTKLLSWFHFPLSRVSPNCIWVGWIPVSGRRVLNGIVKIFTFDQRFRACNWLWRPITARVIGRHSQ